MTVKALAAILVVASAPALLYAQEVEFHEDIKPILESRCYKCHGKKKQKNDLRLDSAESIRAGGENGVVIVPGKPKESIPAPRGNVAALGGVDQAPDGYPVGRCPREGSRPQRRANLRALCGIAALVDRRTLLAVAPQPCLSRL